jgi:hypothetical protein
MRVGVSLGGLAMGRPTGVADTEMTLKRTFAQVVLEVDQLALGTPHLEHIAFEDRHARRVVAAVLEPTEAVDQYIRGPLFSTDITHDSTHTNSPDRDFAPR